MLLWLDRLAHENLAAGKRSKNFSSGDHSALEDGVEFAVGFFDFCFVKSQHEIEYKAAVAEIV